MKVLNLSFHHQSYRADDGCYFHFEPGETKEIPIKYIIMTKDGPLLRQANLVVMEGLPNLLEVNDPIKERWDILDL